jgi:hypothetical protein
MRLALRNRKVFRMAKKIQRHQEDCEALYRLLRQAIEVTETVSKPEYPLTAYMLRVAFAALEEEMKDAIKAAAENDKHYS